MNKIAIVSKIELPKALSDIKMKKLEDPSSNYISFRESNQTTMNKNDQNIELENIQSDNIVKVNKDSEKVMSEITGYQSPSILNRISESNQDLDDSVELGPQNTGYKSLQILNSSEVNNDYTYTCKMSQIKGYQSLQILNKSSDLNQNLDEIAVQSVLQTSGYRPLQILNRSSEVNKDSTSRISQNFGYQPLHILNRFSEENQNPNEESKEF